MDREELRKQLREMPVEASVAFAVRAGLRVLPWLALSKDKQVLGRWPEDDRARHLLAVLLAYDLGVMAVWDRKVPQLRYVAWARRDNAPAAADAAYIAADAAAYANPAAAAAAYAADAYAADADAYANAYAADAADAADADAYAYANAYAADAADAADGDAYRYVSAARMRFQLNAESDFIILRKEGAKKLLESSLWHDATPLAFTAQLSHFQAAVRGLSNGFDLWLDWYDARCRGDAIDVPQLKARVFLPQSIATQSPQVINAYLASLAQGHVAGPLNRVRTIFIGDGEAGKTSLIRVLHDEPVVEGIEAKTPGIEIREWPVPDTAIKASFWDFGGQVMVHATHQLFLRESCLYVLLVSAREKEKATERAEYWLEHVRSFGRGAPVLIVANKADKEPVRLDEGLLLEKYPGMIKGFFQLACTEAQGSFRNQFDQFKQAFCQQLQAVGLHQVQFQKAHFAVLQNLRERTPQQAFLTHQDYAALCAQHRVDAHGVLGSKWLLDILDKLGVIVHFPEMIEMEEYILNPRWLTYGVYTIMYHGQARITRAQAVQLLAATPVQDHDGNVLTYPPAKCRIVFEAMRRYKLCYFLPRDSNQIIIPALLPSDIKRHGMNLADALEFHYQFESFLPRHLISELIVECHGDIGQIDGQDIVWQHGVLLNSETHGAQAVIKADYHLRRLTISLRKDTTAADFLAVLRDRVAHIVKRMDIEYEERIRLPYDAMLDSTRATEGTDWADFLQLLVMRNNGQDTYFHKSGSTYSIGKVLCMFEPQPNGAGSGNINVTLNHCYVDGDVATAKSMQGSFNAQGKK
jgi:GTPase SAR1 family protein